MRYCKLWRINNLLIIICIMSLLNCRIRLSRSFRNIRKISSILKVNKPLEKIGVYFRFSALIHIMLENKLFVVHSLISCLINISGYCHNKFRFFKFTVDIVHAYICYLPAVLISFHEALFLKSPFKRSLVPWAQQLPK